MANSNPEYICTTALVLEAIKKPDHTNAWKMQRERTLSSTHSQPRARGTRIPGPFIDGSCVRRSCIGRSVDINRGNVEVALLVANGNRWWRAKGFYPRCVPAEAVYRSIHRLLIFFCWFLLFLYIDIDWSLSFFDTCGQSALVLYCQGAQAQVILGK